MPSTARPLRERFEERYEVQPDGCWLWRGYLDRQGYGHMSVPSGESHSRWVRAHRVSHELHVGPIPDGFTIDHLCRNRACVNPGHLEAVERGENISRAHPFRESYSNREKTHCPQGHPYEGDNLVVTKSGRRRCRTCVADLNRAQYLKRKAQRGEGSGLVPDPSTVHA